MELRPYQAETLEVVRNELRAGKKRVILYAPTGAGKTEMGMDMIRRSVARGKRVAFVCNRVELVTQASRRFFKAGIEHGVIQGQNTFNTSAQVLICSIQTVSKRGFPDVDLIVIDEAHGVAGSEEYRKLLISRSNVPVVGLTATPFSRGLGKHYQGLGLLFESIAKAVTIRDLIELGFLVDCDIFAPSEPDLTGVKIVAGDYNEKQLGERVDKPALIGDIVAHWFKLAKGQQTVCFATNIAHSKHIVEQFRTAGVTAEHIDCYTDDDERKAILDRVRTGETTVISNVGVLAEGWDCPSVGVMILARPTKSLIRYIQMAGRVLRIFDGKDKALILDHSGSCKSLGYPTDDLPLELDDGKPKAAKKTEGADDPLPKACPSCHFMKPAKVHACPKCGFAPEKRSDVTTQEGELVMLGRKKKLDTWDKAALFGELKHIAQERGWSKGRLSHVFKDIVGTWPNHYQGEPPREPSDKTLRMVHHLNIKFAKSQRSQQRAA